jgi:hypothetical protein
MVRITFFFTSEGNEAIWRTLSTVVFSGHLVLRPLPQVLRAFSQGQMLNHTGTVPLLAPTTHIYYAITHKSQVMESPWWLSMGKWIKQMWCIYTIV